MKATTLLWLNWFVQPVTVPFWVLLLSGLLGFAVAVVFWLIISALHRQSRTETRKNWPPSREPARPTEPTKPDWHHFVSDEIFGVIWRWSYFGDEISQNSLSAFCPKPGCLNRLESVFDMDNPNFSHYGPPCATLICRRCGFKRYFDCHHDSLERRVFSEIERLVNTGQYVTRLKKSE